MLKFIDHYFSSADERGSITGLLNVGAWREVNIIRSQAGITRGNHYHRFTVEGFLILEGKIEVTVQMVKNGRRIGVAEVHTVGAGQVFIIEPRVLHEFKVLESSAWINFLSKSITPEAPDIHRLE